MGLCVRAPFSAICDDENIFRRDTQQYSRKGLNNCELMSCNCNIVKSNEHCLKDVKKKHEKFCYRTVNVLHAWRGTWFKKR